MIRDSILEIAKRARVQIAEDIVEEAIKNMTSYTYAGVANRERPVELIFEILSLAVGTQWNPTGSFTKKGAREAINNEVEITRPTSRVIITVVKRLARLEDGETDWSWFKSLWKKEDGIRKYIYAIDPAKASEMDDVIDNLPTSVPPRPYVGIAAEKVQEDIAKKIDRKISRMRVIR